MQANSPLRKKRFPMPHWLEEMPSGPEKRRAINQFYLRLACLYLTPTGRIREFATLLDMNYHTMKSQFISHNSKGASKTTRAEIHRRLGPAFVPPKNSR